MLRDALLENIHRAQLNPLEEAAAYQQLLEEFGTTHDELAQRHRAQPPAGLATRIRLLNLPVPVQRRVAAGVLSAGHARALLGLDDRDQQDELAAPIVAEGLSVRATEELVAARPRAAARPSDRRRRPAPRITAPAVDRAGRQAVGRLRHPGPGRPRPAQGPDHGRVRLDRRPRADRRGDGARRLAADLRAPSRRQPDAANEP